MRYGQFSEDDIRERDGFINRQDAASIEFQRPQFLAWDVLYSGLIKAKMK